MIALIASLTIAASSAGSGNQTAVLAGGCFWGVEAVFEHVKGVVRVTSGFAGGTVRSPSYEMVNSGATGHAESVEIVYDPSRISYRKILEIFFSVAHDPTQLNRQGPDEGTEYRSAIFYSDSTQKREAESYVQELTRAKVYRQPIVTQIAQLTKFYAAEDYHQDYALHNPTDPYIVYNDLPKVAHLKAKYPELYREWTQPASR